MENIRKRINVRLINDSKKYLNSVRKPNFISQKIFDKNFVAVHQIKAGLILNKPIYFGFCILELTKLLMYKFHYDYVCNKFMKSTVIVFINNALKTRICLILVVIHCYDISNKKVLGKMKDEFNGVQILEFVGLKSKMCSLISVDDKEVNKAKGINEKLRHNEYLDVLFNKKVVRHSMKRIQSKLHGIGTYDIFKISLSCFDDKRYALDDGISTLAYFHKDIVSS